MCVQFQDFKNPCPPKKQKNMRKFEKMSFGFGKNSVSIPISKLDFGFSFRYQNRIWVSHYFLRNTNCHPQKPSHNPNNALFKEQTPFIIITLKSNLQLFSIFCLVHPSSCFNEINFDLVCILQEGPIKSVHFESMSINL